MKKLILVLSIMALIMLAAINMLQAKETPKPEQDRTIIMWTWEDILQGTDGWTGYWTYRYLLAGKEDNVWTTVTLRDIQLQKKKKNNYIYANAAPYQKKYKYDPKNSEQEGNEKTFVFLSPPVVVKDLEGITTIATGITFKVRSTPQSILESISLAILPEGTKNHFAYEPIHDIRYVKLKGGWYLYTLSLKKPVDIETGDKIRLTMDFPKRQRYVRLDDVTIIGTESYAIPELGKYLNDSEKSGNTSYSRGILAGIGFGGSNDGSATSITPIIITDPEEGDPPIIIPDPDDDDPPIEQPPPNPVPEPFTLILTGSGLAAIAGYRKWRNR